MTGQSLRLLLLDSEFSICRLAPNTPAPAWVLTGAFVSMTRTDEELSIVAPTKVVPAEVRAERDWRCLKVAGPLDLSLIGILAALCAPLAAAHIPLFSVSTYDTDYLLVRARDLEPAVAALESAGHSVLGATPLG